MANYGRGWTDGYGGQNPESVEDYVEQDMLEGEQIRGQMEFHRERQKRSLQNQQKKDNPGI